MKINKILLSLLVVAAGTANAQKQDSLYLSHGSTVHAYPLNGLTVSADVDGLSATGTWGTETYSPAAVDSFSFRLPSYYQAGEVKSPYINESFSTNFGDFTVSTQTGTPWEIAYKSAKGSGYSNNTYTKSSSYLISPSIDLLRSSGAELSFDYILRYVGTGLENKVLMTDYYTGDPTTTQWTDLDVQLTEGKDWKTFSNATVSVPHRFIGSSNVRLALYYSCTDASSATWEVKNLVLRETGTVTPPPSGDSTNVNRNVVTAAAPYSWRLEYPKLHNGANDLVLVHSTNSLGITYSIEWDCSKRAQRWTCYQFHNGLPDNNVGRSNDWKEDPLIPSQYRTTHADYYLSGFTRGHMCASSDRQTSVEQNKQTFYYSNMQPQYSTHNSGCWAILENKVKDWGFHGTYRDTLYVVKGGTIDKEEGILSYVGSKKMIVPRYLYMCILAVKNGKYKAIGFWTQQTGDKTKDKFTKYTDYVKSIDEIEKLTGIDFFCNLPDNIEKEVESSYNLSDWGL